MRYEYRIMRKTDDGSTALGEVIETFDNRQDAESRLLELGTDEYEITEFGFSVDAE